MARQYYDHKHNFDTTSLMGVIQPSFIRPVTPMDTWGGVQSSVGRLAPMNKPVFGELYYDSFMFYVKNSDIWNKSRDGQTTEFRDAIVDNDWGGTWPQWTAGYQIDTAGDGSVNIMHGGFGVGLKAVASTPPAIDKLPSMAYRHIYNQFFRNEDIAEVDITAGMNLSVADFKSKGYFDLIQTDIEVGDPVTIDTSGSTLDVQLIEDAIRDKKYQKLKERFGDEYEDILRMHGVKVSHHEGPMLVAKGGTKVGISEVLTTADSGTRDTGDYVGHGILYNKMNVPKRLYLEHGWLIGLTVLRPRFAIKQRVDKIFHALDPKDLYHKFYVGNKMRNVENREVYSALTTGHQDTYSYAEHYDYLRKSNDIIAGAYLDSAVYDDQILATEYGSAGGPSQPASHQQVTASRWDHIWQDSTEPNIYLHHKNSIGVNSPIPRRRV